ncbi:YbaB/EbfC family nucleoid-associated protein [Gramella sp. GC03-9]|uniref:Nucleoid-associated protein MKO06_12215 n=1 Tax=Christiangramia oceanisediminis TaxID=2920386 RepID=A0A9X2R940_9FLAO|nr:YbaB/EbfC family nucleoid-associated protein [Gramella oceanisediminis]MCP9200677.1 YbaB/EbfC family nucleoid-associated protein [Gramella oceanisediminis]
MFGDMMGMMNKLKEAQANVEATKKRMDTVMVEEKSTDGLLKVTVTANRQLKNISIDDELMNDKEQLEDYLILTLNNAIQKAGEIHETEVAAAAKDGMPDIPGMSDMLK